MIHSATRRSPLVAAARQSALVAGMLAAATGGCKLPQPPPVDPIALAALEQRGTETRYRRLPPLPDERYYLNRQDRNDPRNYDPLPIVEEEVGRTARGQTGEIGLHIPTTQATAEPAEPPNPVVYIELADCVRRATMNNFTVAVAGYGPAIAETRVVEALGRYDPTFRLSSEFQQQQGVSLLDNFFTDNTRLTIDSALSQLLPSGGSLELGYRALRTDSDSASFLSPIPPGVTWTSDLALQLTQPVLRDFGYDVNRARIYVNRNDQRISVLEFRLQLEEVLFRIEETYWQLYRAQRLVEVREDLLQRHVEHAFRIWRRQERDATRADLSQALAALRRREAELIEAKVAAAQLSDQLKGLMNDPDLPIGSRTLVLTATQPVLVPLLFDLESAVAVAALHRPELSQQILRILNQGRILNVAESNRLPRLDLLLRGGFSGFDDDYADAVSDQFNFDNFSVGAGFQFEVPLGNRQARAILARSRLEREQAVTQYERLLHDVKLAVSQAQRQLFGDYARIERYRKARLDARDAVEQAEILEASGAALTPQFSDIKLGYLADYSDLLSTEAQAIAEYNIALAEYERAKGTLLRYHNVVLQEAPLSQQLPPGRNPLPAARARR